MDIDELLLTYLFFFATAIYVLLMLALLVTTYLSNRRRLPLMLLLCVTCIASYWFNYGTAFDFSILTIPLFTYLAIKHSIKQGSLKNRLATACFNASLMLFNIAAMPVLVLSLLVLLDTMSNPQYG